MAGLANSEKVTGTVVAMDRDDQGRLKGTGEIVIDGVAAEGLIKAPQLKTHASFHAIDFRDSLIEGLTVGTRVEIEELVKIGEKGGNDKLVYAAPKLSDPKKPGLRAIGITLLE